MLNLPLTGTPATVVFGVLLAVGIGVLLARRDRRWLRCAVPVALIVALLLTVVAGVLIERVWRPFPDALPLLVYVWSGLVLFAVALAVARWTVRERTSRRRALGLLGVCALAVVAALIGGAAQINAIYHAYPTVGAVLGVKNYRTVPFGAALGSSGAPALQTRWTPPPDLPKTGAVTAVPIPGAVSKFGAREARVYLPPAYFASPRPLLPVLVLMAGQPGSTDDWLVGGRLAEIMDRFAAQHRGLAPVVVLADGTGSQFGNPMCVDSHFGNVATYLAVDVPAWVRAHLQIDPNPRAWAIGGLSYGGTCSLQLATTRPDVYPTFLDLSGQAEPTRGGRRRSVNEVFGGNEAAFDRNNPAYLLAHYRFPDSGGAFVVGRDDRTFRPGIEQLYTAARAAGMDVRLSEVPGSHSFAVWSAGLEMELPWISQRLGLDRL
ncbi:MAG: alpha/beta hydrolase-fold protein [Gordonia sp. (in: high G+C Gram-positive bacteria)]